MINLLPIENKKEIRAARANRLLVRYNFMLLGAVAFLMLATGIVYIYLTNTKSSTEQTIAENNQKVSSYAVAQAQANNFKSNLTTAKQILDREVTYTKVILEIAHLLPPGVTLNTLSLDAKTFGTETTLVANAKSYAAALSLKDSFQNSKLFTNVHFQSISSGDSVGAYPYVVNLNVTIQKDAAK